MNFTVRDATPNDLDAICAIDARSFKQPWARASFQGALDDAARSVFLVAETSEICAFGVAWSVGDEAEIATLAVSHSARGRGLGEIMMRALCEKLAERGARAVFLEVRPSNGTARRLYQKLGFALVGERPNYYADGESALILKKTNE
jgi:ribosomal-protein-alanine N-acetyltransferase